MRDVEHAVRKRALRRLEEGFSLGGTPLTREGILTLEELKGRPLEEVLKDVADRQMRMAVSLPDGREVVIESKPLLKPLPELEGSIPNGWKDALYARD